MLWVPLNMGMSAAHCQGISECLESGHRDYYYNLSKKKHSIKLLAILCLLNVDRSAKNFDCSTPWKMCD